MIICSNEDEDNSYMISKLQLYRRPVTILFPDDVCAEYLKAHFINCHLIGDMELNIPASVVDPEK